MVKQSSKVLPTTERLSLALRVLSDKKAEDIVTLDLRELQYILCDYFVVATAESDRQAQAIVEAIIEQLKIAEGERIGYRVEGYEVGQWILLDLGDVVIHVLSPEARRYYRLEELWGDAKLVPHA
ncbi:MAG: ribosome silencing factor [Bacteroidia bacterium]|nr:ribosome silencing factor [Bacteroidia bacterium]MCX7651480.1 ribosome silencing factor [Bacteroidia bacterium]MDW8416765.1 ribosome silencing factor [Bacteroidia bacterium]